MFDTLTTNAVDLQQLLSDGKVSSVEILEQYLAQVDRYNPKLNAFISLAPRKNVLDAAKLLDKERQQGKLRGPLHGIPIVLKDCLVTASTLGMDTTAGAWAFVGLEARNNGAIVQKLLDAGLIVLGKTNMTEFCGMKMFTTVGRSAVSGQTISPYTGDIGSEEDGILRHSSPGGSSTGSAVAVAAGFSPLAIGTETTGSMVTPSNRAALYSLKPTVGVQDAKGMYRMTDTFDSPGPMAKSPADLALLAEILLGRPFKASASKAWLDVSIGFVSPAKWTLPSEMCRQYDGTTEQMVRDYESMVALLTTKGCRVKYPVGIPEADVLTVDDEPAIMPIAFWEFKNIGLPMFIESFEDCPVGSLEELIKFNEANKERALPPPHGDQDFLIQSLNTTEDEEKISHLRRGLRDKARQILEEVFIQHDVNLLAAPVDSGFATYAASAGYPICTVPLGQLEYNQRPFGINILARANDEETLLNFMAAYEAVHAPRPVPELSKFL